jgi:hypothetical protein
MLTTDAQNVYEQADAFVSDLMSPDAPEEDFEQKYDILFTASKSLFDMIKKDVKKSIVAGTFDREKFLQRLRIMTNLIVDIQANKISQYNASVIVGKDISEEYLACVPR